MTQITKPPIPGAVRSGPPVPSPTATQYVRLGTLLTMVPMSASTVWRKVRAGSFPRPVKLSVRITAWELSAVERWARERGAS